MAFVIRASDSSTSDRPQALDEVGRRYNLRGSRTFPPIFLTVSTRATWISCRDRCEDCRSTANFYHYCRWTNPLRGVTGRSPGFSRPFNVERTL